MSFITQPTQSFVAIPGNIASDGTVSIAGSAVAANAATFSRGLKAPGAVNTPERMAAVGTYVQSVTIWAQRAARVANASTVYIDAIATNDAQLVALVPGGFISISAPPGKVIDLGDIYVDAVTLTDGVFFLAVV